jgi:hypothetical protein
MRRRDFIKVVAGSVVAWPLAARAQRPERMRRIGVILGATADDAEFQAWFGAFLQGLQQSGWSIGQNVRIDTRWATANAAEIRRHAAELVALAPDVILAHGASTVGPLLQATRTVPIVFPVAGDPVAAGFVDSLARPPYVRKSVRSAKRHVRFVPIADIGSAIRSPRRRASSERGTVRPSALAVFILSTVSYSDRTLRAARRRFP